MDLFDKEITFYEIDVTDAEVVDVIFRNYKRLFIL